MTHSWPGVVGGTAAEGIRNDGVLRSVLPGVENQGLVRFAQRSALHQIGTAQQMPSLNRPQAP